MSPGDGIAARLAVVQSRTVTTRHGARRAVCSGLVLWFGRAPRMGLVAFSVALIPLILVDARAGAERQSRGEGRIAFTRGESGAPRPAQLAVIDADGKNRRVLPPFDVLGLSLSPDGRFIAFKPYSPMAGCSCAPGDLMTITVDDRLRYRRVVHHDSLGGGLAWSPDGRSIAFALRGGGIWAVNLSNHRQRRIVRDGWDPTWSPDGKKLAFERGQEQAPDLWVVDLATKKERRLVRNGRSPDWSPDGRRIVFYRCYPCFIHVIRADGTAQRRLFAGNEPVWSPNGKEIAFIGKDARHHYYDAIIRARLDGSGRRVLFGQVVCGCGPPDWSR